MLLAKEELEMGHNISSGTDFGRREREVAYKSPSGI
jgi:hypothetical protein